MRRSSRRSFRAPSVEALERRALLTDILQGGFEVPPQMGGYTYRPSGSAWEFVGNSGLSANGTAITSGNPVAPEGVQVGFIQGTGTISQTSSGWSAGQYVFRLIAAQRGNVSGNDADLQLLVDGNVVGAIRPSGASYAAYTSDPFEIAAGSHTFSIRGANSSGSNGTVLVDSVTVQATPGFADASFEQPRVGPVGEWTSYRVAPAGTAWTYTGSSGVTANGSGHTAGNPASADGNQVAFLQGSIGSTISQTVTGWSAGRYAITFRAAQRANVQSSAQDFLVLVDGQSVGFFRPTDSSYARYATVPFEVTPGAHRITFQGLNTASGDNTVLIDAIAIEPVATAGQPAVAVSDSGFESPFAGPVGQWTSFRVAPSGSAWTYTGSAGVTANGSGHTQNNPTAVDGTQVAFLQYGPDSTFSQVVSGWSAGSYTITFRAAQRVNVQAAYQDFRVLVDGSVVGTFRPSGSSYAAYATPAFTVSAGAHTIQFQGLNTAGGDNTALIDTIAIEAAGTSGQPAVSDSGFEAPFVGPVGQWTSFRVTPTGSAWTYTGSSGVTANGSGHTVGNPASTDGNQVAFLQYGPSSTFSQAVAGWSAGSYTISFRAAQRANVQSAGQDFRILIDGQPVGYFRPSGTAYDSYTTAPFRVEAGTHQVTFQGLNSSGGDNTALIDAIVIAAATPAPTTEATGVANAGVNPEAIGFVSTGPIFTDITKLLMRWGQADSPWAPDPNLPVDAYGYPLIDAGAGAPMRGYPLGVYTLRYQGTGDVSIYGIGHLITPITTVNGVKTAQILIDKTYDETGSQFYLGLRNIDPNDPIRNLQIIMPGYDPVNPPTFANEFLARLEPFSTIRFMDWMRTNNSPLVHWADRTQPTAFSMAGDLGVAYELMVELANQLHKDIWVNIPVNADEDFIHQFAALLRDQLDPALKIYVEYSNELWNPSFSQYNALVARGWANPALDGASNWVRGAQEAGFRIRQIGQIFKAEFGARASQIRPVLDAQAVWDGTQRITLDYLAATGSVSQDLYGLAIAPYLGFYSTDPNLTLDQIFEGLNQSLNANLSGIALNRALATQYGLSLLAYEGGVAMTAEDNATFAVKQAAQHDPRMGQVLRAYYDAWTQAGGSLFMQYTLSGQEKPWGYWGMLTSNNDVGSVKYDAMMASFLTGGDATLDASVGFDDFEVVAANYGTTGTKWWAQGDFNADNVVNDLDLAILKRNIRGLTPAQGLAVSLFGLPTTGRVGSSILFLGAADPGLAIDWRLSMAGQTIAQASGTGFWDAMMAAGTYTLDVTVRDSTGTSVVTGQKTVVIVG